MERLTAALSGRYRVERELGQGGMATVFLAEDLKHKRSVAVKVLKPELAAVVGAERFLTEIETTANLQHPHILPLFDSGEADGFLYYVMPYVEGESLRERLDREKQLPVGDAVRIAKAIASALDYAHRQGVVHRDIKPANILLQDDQPLLADFGIALAVQEAGGGRLTETGLSLGTPYYMSPEQATAERDPGPTSDVYSLGAVLYEMLTGSPPYSGPTAQAVLARILTGAPTPPTELRASVPADVEAVVLRSLEKLPADRIQSARGMAEALENPDFRQAALPSAKARGEEGGATTWWSSRPALWAGGAMLLVLAFVAGSLWTGPAGDARPGQATRMSIVIDGGDGLRLREGPSTNSGRPSLTTLALSPDGRTLVFVGERDGIRQLYARPLGREEATPIAGTGGAIAPFFSPAGDQVGFFAGGSMMRVPLDGSPPVAVTEVGRPLGASWGDDGRIVFRDGNLPGLRRVPASGGEVEELPSDPGAHVPWALPGSEVVLYTVGYDVHGDLSDGLTPEDRRIEALTMATGAVDTLLENASDARYVSTGHLAFARVGRLMAVRFDPASLELSGGPFGVLPDVMHAMNGANIGHWTDAAQYTVSPAGHLAWIEGGTTPVWENSVALFDRNGTKTPVELRSNFYLAARLSPDGGRVVATAPAGRPGLFVIDLEGTGRARRLVSSPTMAAMWTPDGREVVYWGAGDGLHRVPADGSGPSRELGGTGALFPMGWTGRGTEVLYVAPQEGFAVGLLDVESGEQRTVLEEPGWIESPDLSPDERWIAYSTNGEVVVRSWPALEDRRVLAAGTQPLWTRNGSELLFVRRLDEGEAIMAVGFDVAGGRPTGEPQELFRHAKIETFSIHRGFDATPDGERLLVGLVENRPIDPPSNEIHILLDWFTELEGE